MRVLFLGQKPLGEACFDRLSARHGRGLEIVGVVTNDVPDVWWGSADIWERSRALGIPHISNSRRNTDQIRTLVESRPFDVLLSVQHPWILPADVLGRPQRAALNFHNAGLPEYQGHNCCNHALLNGDRSYRTTVHHLSLEVDGGDIAYETTVEVDGDETAHSLYVKSNAAAILLFEKAMSALDSREPLPRRAQAGEPRFFHRNSIDELRDATDEDDPSQLDRIARSLYFPPFDPAFIRRSGERQPLLPARRADSVRWTRVFGRAMPGDDRLKSENVR